VIVESVMELVAKFITGVHNDEERKAFRIFLSRVFCMSLHFKYSLHQFRRNHSTVLNMPINLSMTLYIAHDYSEIHNQRWVWSSAYPYEFIVYWLTLITVIALLRSWFIAILDLCKFHIVALLIFYLYFYYVVLDYFYSSKCHFWYNCVPSWVTYSARLPGIDGKGVGAKGSRKETGMHRSYNSFSSGQ